MSKPFYITTPIYYVNDKPHVGHSYTTIAADLIARYHRLNGREAFFLTGTDEHGTKVAEAAEKAGLDPKSFCDGIVQQYKDAWKALDINYGDFIRTTDKRHEVAVQKLLSILHEAKTPDGEAVIYPDVYEGLYCTGCEKFLTEKELVDGLCPDHKRPPQVLSEKNYFFRLSAYLDKIKELIEANEIEIMRDERRKETLGLFEQGLSDISISREKVKWGIPLPFDSKQVTYVWVEALTNYLSGIGYGADDAKFKKWWLDSEIVHLMAKEILKFHCILWPAMLIAAGLPLPKTIFLHGFFTVNGEKMSKSLGNQIDPRDMVEQFGPDASRYLLLTQYPFGADGDIKESRFVSKYNSDLANDLGNLVSRTAKMIISNFDGKIPNPADGIEGVDELVSEAEKLPGVVLDHINNFRLLNAIEAVMGLVRRTNRFFDTNAPWKLVKDGDLKKAGGVLYISAEAVRIIAIMISPIMPNKAVEILNVFGLDKDELSVDSARTFYRLEAGSKIALKESIFPRLQETKTKRTEDKSDDAGDGLVDVDSFFKNKLVVAEVLEAEKVEGADKLLRLQIDVGGEKRQIVAGIALHYAPEDLVGKRIVVVKNLKPAKIRGIKSNGMLLAAKKGKRLTLVMPEQDIEAGAEVG